MIISWEKPLIVRYINNIKIKLRNYSIYHNNVWKYLIGFFLNVTACGGLLSTCGNFRCGCKGTKKIRASLTISQIYLLTPVNFLSASCAPAFCFLLVVVLLLWQTLTAKSYNLTFLHPYKSCFQMCLLYINYNIINILFYN